MRCPRCESRRRQRARPPRRRRRPPREGDDDERSAAVRPTRRRLTRRARAGQSEAIGLRSVRATRRRGRGLDWGDPRRHPGPHTAALYRQLAVDLDGGSSCRAPAALDNSRYERGRAALSRGCSVAAKSQVIGWPAALPGFLGGSGVAPIDRPQSSSLTKPATRPRWAPGALRSVWSGLMLSGEGSRPCLIARLIAEQRSSHAAVTP